MSPERSVLIGSSRDDHRVAVRAALEEHGFGICTETADAQSALAAAAAHRPNVVLLDASLPGDGITAAAQIMAAVPSTSVVMLGDCDATDQLMDAIRVGASGYLPYDSHPSAIATAAAAVVAGEAALPRALVPRVIEEIRKRAPVRDRATSGLASLTAREREVLALLADGLGTAEIGARLFVSKVTVRTHVSSILHKLGVRDRVSAVLVAQGVEIGRSTPRALPL